MRITRRFTGPMQNSDLTTPSHSSPSLGARASRWRLLARSIVALLLVLVMCSHGSFAYSVLTHEEIVDLLWSDEIRPLLLQRYPGLSDDQIKEAHAYVYGVEVKDVLAHEDLAIGSYRFSVSRLIPEMTQVALQTHKKDIIREHPDFAKQKFLYRLKRSDYEKEWGKDYTKPGLGARILAVFFRLIPKVGPFKGLGFKNPTPQTEDMYFKSINSTVDQYRTFLRAVGTDSLQLPNCDLDSGQATKAAEYSLTDDTYAKLLGQLSGQKFDRTTPELRDNILGFYSDLSASIETKKDQEDWREVLAELDQLKAMTPTPVVAGNPPSDSHP